MLVIPYYFADRFSAIKLCIFHSICGPFQNYPWTKTDNSLMTIIMTNADCGLECRLRESENQKSFNLFHFRFLIESFALTMEPRVVLRAEWRVYWSALPGPHWLLRSNFTSINFHLSDWQLLKANQPNNFPLNTRKVLNIKCDYFRVKHFTSHFGNEE